jgi:hypothetical protein
MQSTFDLAEDFSSTEAKWDRTHLSNNVHMLLGDALDQAEKVELLQ